MSEWGGHGEEGLAWPGGVAGAAGDTGHRPLAAGRAPRSREPGSTATLWVWGKTRQSCSAVRSLWPRFTEKEVWVARRGSEPKGGAAAAGRPWQRLGTGWAVTLCWSPALAQPQGRPSHRDDGCSEGAGCPGASSRTCPGCENVRPPPPQGPEPGHLLWRQADRAAALRPQAPETPLPVPCTAGQRNARAGFPITELSQRVGTCVSEEGVCNCRGPSIIPFGTREQTVTKLEVDYSVSPLGPWEGFCAAWELPAFVLSHSPQAAPSG